MELAVLTKKIKIPLINLPTILKILQRNKTTKAFTWKPGNKPGVSFANLSQLQRYEPETYSLFKQLVFDMQRVETAKYNYMIRMNKWGPSVTRFQIEEQPQQQPEPEQQQPVSTQGSLAKLEATFSPKTKAILELRQLLSQMNLTLQELETEIGK